MKHILSDSIDAITGLQKPSGFPSALPSNYISCFSGIFSGYEENTMIYYQNRQVSNIKRTFVGNSIIDHSDVVGASPVGAAPTTSSFSA